MFTIRHKILNQTIEELEELDLDEFKHEFDEDIEGQIQINFDGKTIGYVNDEIPLAEEWLILWLTKLNEAIEVLNKFNYAAFYIPDTDNIWIELKGNCDFIEVCKVKLKLENSDKSLVAKPIDEFEKYDWDGTTINKNEFVENILQDSEVLVSEIFEINYKLMESESIKNLKKVIYINKNFNK
ncbi:MAG: hypothetical protein Q4F66_13300 [Clostridium sp.]|nr:hypothetical protein [Clostridium sp.]